MKVYKLDSILNTKYGSEGSLARDDFKEKATHFYYGQIIKERRKELKLTQEAVAKIIGKKRSYISRVENGEDIQLSNLILISNALGLSVELKQKNEVEHNQNEIS